MKNWKIHKGKIIQHTLEQLVGHRRNQTQNYKKKIKTKPQHTKNNTIQKKQHL